MTAGIGTNAGIAATDAPACGDAGGCAAGFGLREQPAITAATATSASVLRLGIPHRLHSPAMAAPAQPATAVESDRGFFGHPRGLATLFFTEMWERFSYYGTRAILILFMTAAATTGGLGFDVPNASAIYATYVSSVWYLPLVGGWLADKFLGA